MISRREWLQATAAVGLVGLAGCKPSEKERAVASRLVERMTTHAVGRHLVDVPSDFEMEGGNVVLTYGLDTNFTTVRVEIENFSATPESFAAFVRETKLKVSSETHDKLLNTSMLIETIELSPTAVLLRSYRDSLRINSFHTELIALVGTVLVTAWKDSYDGNYAPTTKRLTRVASQLSDVSSETDGGKGFQIGKLLIATDHDQEYGDAFFRSKTASAVLVKVLVNALMPDPSPSLITRWESARWVEATMGRKPKTVRRGVITLAGMQGEELLTEADMDGRLVMKLWAESKRPTPGFATPLLEVQLDSEPNSPEEKATPAPWTESDTIAVWDAIVKSVRPKVGAV